MKTTIYTLAIAALLPTAALADFSDRNDGLTKQVMCSNVPARSGSVAGIFIPTIGYFVEEAVASYATAYVAGVMPAGLSSKDWRDVQAYLTSIGLTNYEPVIRRDSEERVETVEQPVPRDVFDGSPQDWHHAAMDGSNTIRLRLADDRPVDLRIGGRVIATVSGVGEGLVDLPEGQKFGGIKLHDATTGEALRGGTVSTNGSIWDGTQLTEVAQTFSRNGDWCR